jgi:hypothetical protein
MNAATAFERLAGFLDRRMTSQGWVARRILERGYASDDTLREQLFGRILTEVKRDRPGPEPLGWLSALEELINLEGPASAISAGLDRLLALVGQPGAFGQGCTTARHTHRVCEHFLGGFFGVAPPSQRVAPISLPNGRTFRVESQARFAVSCWMLRVALIGGRWNDPGVQKHLASFAHLLAEWEAWTDFLAPDLAFGAIGALAMAPDRWRPTLESLVRIVANKQLKDGTWPRVDFFNALDGLCRVNHPLVQPILAGALPGLLQRQRDDGSFGNVAPDERALIGLRVLRRLQ